jgi:hypothetical protein
MRHKLKVLRIKFGGLCLFVQRGRLRRSSGLFVLLPRIAAKDMEHCAMLRAAGEFRPSGTPLVKNLRGAQPDDLTRLRRARWRGHSMPWAANVTEYTGRPVADRWLKESPAPDGLAWRLRLPYGTQPVPFGDMARIYAEGQPTYLLAGQCRIDLFVDPSEWELPLLIAGEELCANVKQEVCIEIINLPPDEILNPPKQPRRFTQKKEVHHVRHGYYPLLAPVGGTTPEAPRIYAEPNATAEDQEPPDDGTGDDHDHSRRRSNGGTTPSTCDDVFIKLMHTLGPLGIDPTTCTIGGGG